MGGLSRAVPGTDRSDGSSSSGIDGVKYDTLPLETWGSRPIAWKRRRAWIFTSSANDSDRNDSSQHPGQLFLRTHMTPKPHASTKSTPAISIDRFL